MNWVMIVSSIHNLLAAACYNKFVVVKNNLRM